VKQIAYLSNEKSKSSQSFTLHKRLVELTDNLPAKEKKLRGEGAILTKLKCSGLRKEQDEISKREHKHNIAITELTDRKELIRSTLTELQKQCIADNFYWQYCPFSVFESNYEILTKDIFSLHPDATIKEVLIEEIRLIERSLSSSLYFGNETFPENSIHIEEFLDETAKENFKYSQKRKLEFLKRELTRIDAKEPQALPAFKVKNRSNQENNVCMLNDLLFDITDENSQLTKIEVYNYLESITSSFNPDKVKMIGEEINLFYQMEYLPRIQEESIQIFTKNNWEIPYRKISLDENIAIYDFEIMLQKTHFADLSLIKYAKALIQSKQAEAELKVSAKPDDTPAKSVNPHPRIFKDNEAFELFKICNEKITDRIADYSYFYRKMNQEGLIIAPCNEFAKWLDETYQIADLIPKIKTLQQLGNIDKRTAIYSSCKESQLSRKNPHKTE